MEEIDENGITNATKETTKALHCSLDLHAYHHFTRCAAVDGSLQKEVIKGQWVRRLAYGIWEGAREGETDGEGLWGASLPSDLEIADAETYAIYAYLMAPLS